MKTLEEIKQDIAHEYGSKDYCKDFEYGIGLNKFMNEWEFMDKATKRYALEAIKADREKIIDAKMHICEIDDITKPMLEDHQKEIILNLPYELP